MPLRIREVSAATLSPTTVATMASIARHYYPPVLDLGVRLEAHLTEGARVLIAEADEEIVGYALSSCERRQTPFHARPIPCVYQRQLFVIPEARGRHVGSRLQIATLRLHLGPFWLWRRFLLFCLTHNPEVVKNYRLFSEYHPRLDSDSVPPAVLTFARQLLPLVGGRMVDAGLRVHGSFKAVLKGEDYGFWWQRYLATGEPGVDAVVQARLFRREGERLVHSGLSLLMIGYSKPGNFLRRYLSLYLRRLFRPPRSVA